MHVYKESASFNGLIYMDSYVPKGETEAAAKENTPLVHCIWTVVIVSSTLMVALFLKAVMVVWSVMGATVCFMVAFVLPAAYYLKIQRTATSTEKVRRRIICVFLLAFSFVTIIACTAMTLAKVIKGQDPCP